MKTRVEQMRAAQCEEDGHVKHSAVRTRRDSPYICQRCLAFVRPEKQCAHWPGQERCEVCSMGFAGIV